MTHYDKHPSGIKPIDICKYEDFIIGNVLKYVMRRKFKGDELGDLIKARAYIDLAIDEFHINESKKEVTRDSYFQWQKEYIHAVNIHEVDGTVEEKFQILPRKDAEPKTGHYSRCVCRVCEPEYTTYVLTVPGTGKTESAKRYAESLPPDQVVNGQIMTNFFE